MHPSTSPCIPRILKLLNGSHRISYIETSLRSWLGSFPGLGTVGQHFGCDE